jgi:CRP-like cAMP-binding protein
MSLESSKIEDALRDLPLFRDMEVDLLHGLMASARIARHEKGSVFLEQDQSISRFYIILDGWCGAVKSNVDGQESILQIFSRGDFLPEPGHALSLTASLMTLQALTDVELAMLTPSIVRNALEHSKTFSANMLAASVQRCNNLRNHIEQLTLQDAEHRVGRFLLDMRLTLNEVKMDISLPFDKSLIASYLGIKPETLSRTLHLFKDRGFIVDRTHVHMPNDHALCEYCDSLATRTCRHMNTGNCPQHEKTHAVIS